MVVTASWDFDVLICHSDVLSVNFEIVWSGHDNKLNRFLIAKCFIRPNTSIPVRSQVKGTNHFRIDRISLTAAIPLLAINTLVITVCPPLNATKSFTGPGAAFSTEFPPSPSVQTGVKLPKKCGARFVF
jgi:hypothetical protein